MEKLQNSFSTHITDFSHLYTNCILLFRQADLQTWLQSLSYIKSCVIKKLACVWNIYIYVPEINFCTHLFLLTGLLSHIMPSLIENWANPYTQNYMWTTFNTIINTVTINFTDCHSKPLNMLSNVPLMSTKHYQNMNCWFCSWISIISVPNKLRC